MQPTSAEIEQIIRVVMQRLAAANDLIAGVGQLAEPSAAEAELDISDRVVTLSLVEKKLDGKRRVRVHPRAVVTPAVNDLLRSMKIELVRASNTSPIPRMANPKANKTEASNANAPSPAVGHRLAPILVCGSALWFNSLSRHLCSKQATVQACEDSAATGLVSQHIDRGGQRAVWLSSLPFAASIAASRADCCTSVQLPSLRELNDALGQANPQLLIVDASRWTVAAIGNLVRSLAKHPVATGHP